MFVLSWHRLPHFILSFSQHGTKDSREKRGGGSPSSFLSKKREEGTPSHIFLKSDWLVLAVYQAGPSGVSCQDVLSLLQEQQHEEEDDAICNEAMDAFECQPLSNSTSFNKVEVVSILRLQEPFNLILNLTNNLKWMIVSNSPSRKGQAPSRRRRVHKLKFGRQHPDTLYCAGDHLVHLVLCTLYCARSLVLCWSPSYNQSQGGQLSQWSSIQHESNSERTCFVIAPRG